MQDDERQDQKSETLEERDKAQEEQLDAHQRGDIAGELGGFVKEVVSDQKQFPADVVEDSRDPERRVDEEQGTPEHPGHEPEAGTGGG
jgi:hypothetical protein